MVIQTILIVDDDKPLVQLFKEHIFLKGSERYVVKTAYNGNEALDILKTNPIDLIILDVQMPVMDGLQFLAELHNRGIWLPVIILTSSKVDELEEKFNEFLEFGIVDYLQKPISLEELDRRIEEILRIRIDKDSISGISLHGILQVLEMERKTAVVSVNIRGKDNKIFVKEGDIMDVEAKGLTADEALEECIKYATERQRISIEYISHKREKKLQKSLTEILLEASRMWDEKNKGPDEF